MVFATHEDLRTIWHCLSHTCWLLFSHEKVKAFERGRGEVAWQALEQFLDLGDIEGKARQAGATGRQRKAGRQKEGTSGAAGLPLDRFSASLESRGGYTFSNLSGAQGYPQISLVGPIWRCFAQRTISFW